jgi:transcriptional regulator with XRE-family HTH domain
MLDNQVAKYFQQRDHKNPQAKQNRRYFRLMFSIAEGLLQMRKRAGLTQQQLAEKLHTTQSAIARWESAGCSGYTLAKLFEIAERLDHSISIQFLDLHQTPVFEQSVERNWGTSPELRMIRQASSRPPVPVQQARSLHETIYNDFKEVHHDQTYMVTSM